MRVAVLLAAALSGYGASAQPLPDRVAQLIPDDAVAVTCVDVARHGQSPLGAVFPPRLATGVDGWQQWVERMISVELPARFGFVIVTGPEVAQLAAAISAAESTDFRPAAVLVDRSTLLLGDPRTLEETRQRASPQVTGALGNRAKQLSGQFDSWWLAVKPLENAQRCLLCDRPRKHLDELITKIRTVSAGVRFGGTVEVHAEAELESSEDAIAAATLARWVPGLLQMDRADNLIASLSQISESFTTQARGNVASLDFVLRKEQLQSLLTQAGPLQ